MSLTNTFSLPLCTHRACRVMLTWPHMQSEHCNSMAAWTRAEIVVPAARQGRQIVPAHSVTLLGILC